MNLSIPIYMDYTATTPVDERVAEKMCSYLTRQGLFGNPASRSHEFGWKAEEAVEQARVDVARLINANPKEIIWTSGATESDMPQPLSFTSKRTIPASSLAVTTVT